LAGGIGHFHSFARHPGEGRDPHFNHPKLGTVDTGLCRYDEKISSSFVEQTYFQIGLPLPGRP
jgi:hypothetical protein